ncbi:MAG: hypothetical protein ACRDQ5_22630, partial [Sciscionella sp.]
MMTVLAVAVGVLAVVVFIQFGALIEMFEQLKQVRAYLDMEDNPHPLDLGDAVGMTPSTAGLPARLDDIAAATVLFISDKCTTCATLATELKRAGLPEAMWLVVVPVTGDAAKFVATFGLHGERILVDADHSVSSTIGIDVTPVALMIESGRLAGLQTVPTTRQMYAALPGASNGHAPKDGHRPRRSAVEHAVATPMSTQRGHAKG